MMKLVRMVALLLVFFYVPAAMADESQNNDAWEFNLTPFYLWAFDITGDQTIGSASGSLDVEFSDVLDNLEAGFIVRFEAMHENKWGFAVDYDHLDLENSNRLPSGFVQKVDIDLTVGEVIGLRRWDMSGYSLDLVFGARYYEIANEISLGNQTLVDGSKDWLDPIIGGRWIWSFADNWSLVARADIGGFGAGSDFAWQTIGLVEWAPFTYVTFLAGYRALGADYEDGTEGQRDYFNFDATIHGPLLGINFRW